MDKTRAHNTPAAYRRQVQIEDCLYENLQHTPYQSISVADLCRQVGISRKAFYNYYRDKDACFCAIIDRFLRESMLAAASAEKNDVLASVVSMLDYWKGKKIFFDIVIRNNLFYFVLLRNMEYVLREERSVLELLNTPYVHSDTDILACYMSSQLTLVLQWYYRGFDTPTEEMAKKYIRILHAPMLPLPEAE